MVISRIFPREPHYCVRNDATGPQGSESPFSLIPKGSRPVHSPERVVSTKTPEHKKEDLKFDRNRKGTTAEDDRRAQNGVSASPTSVVPTELFPPDQPLHEAISSIEEREEFLNWWQFELTPIERLEVATRISHENDIDEFWCRFWDEWNKIGAILEVLYSTDEMDAFTAPWPTWSAYTDSLYLRTVDEDEFSDGEERPDSKPPPEKKTADSTASPADTTEISTAPPESETEILTASST